MNIGKGPWTNIDINSTLTFSQFNSLTYTGEKAVKLTLESLRTFEYNREKPLRDYRDVLQGYRKRLPPKRTFASKACRGLKMVAGPVINKEGDHYLPLEAVIDTDTTDLNRPSTKLIEMYCIYFTIY
ncbi:Hypothetical predicted protein [Paramuricea clavata]|uniref:Uncharacterized protein n=1 Tax=Paramuricea clavata TaxID=317549 RepID=A0A7D9DDE1_PARCT|nr:Hypothetical predicted protein [Paramuricea clavata]